jgi:hypothetical protein
VPAESEYLAIQRWLGIGALFEFLGPGEGLWCLAEVRGVAMFPPSVCSNYLFFAVVVGPLFDGAALFDRIQKIRDRYPASSNGFHGHVLEINQRPKQTTSLTPSLVEKLGVSCPACYPNVNRVQLTQRGNLIIARETHSDSRLRSDPVCEEARRGRVSANQKL